MYHAKHYSYQISRYCSNNQTAITAYQKGITDEQIQAEEPAPEAVVTINLEDYGMEPDGDEIFIPKYKLSPALLAGVLEDLGEKNVVFGTYGYSAERFYIGSYKAECLRLKLNREAFCQVSVGRLIETVDEWTAKMHKDINACHKGLRDELSIQLSATLFGMFGSEEPATEAQGRR